jgi:CubicO group peptidase (beta-lactamase class C family)
MKLVSGLDLAKPIQLFLVALVLTFNATGIYADTNFENEITKILEPLISKRKIPGYYLAVFKGGVKVLEKSEGYADDKTKLVPQAETLYALDSMIRPLTASALMVLVESGELSLNDPVTKFLPSFGKIKVADSGSLIEPLVLAEREITLLDLLTHTSGLTYGAAKSSNQTKNNDVSKLYEKNGVFTQYSEIGELSLHIKALSKLPLIAQPGEKFNLSVGYDVISRVIEIASGLTFESFLAQRVLLPLEMTDTHFVVPPEKMHRLARMYSPAFWGFNVPGTPKMYQNSGLTSSDYKNVGIKKPTRISGGTGLISTPHDYSKFLNFLLQRKHKNSREFSQSTFDLMLTDQLQINLSEPREQILNEPGFSFSLGMAIKNKSNSKSVSANEEMQVDYLYGQSDYDTQFWIDPANEVFGLFMVQIFPANYPLVAQLENVADRFLSVPPKN